MTSSSCGVYHDVTVTNSYKPRQSMSSGVGTLNYTSLPSKGLVFSTTKMLLLPILAMATHEIKKLITVLDPGQVLDDDMLVRGVYVDPGQSPTCMPYHLDDLIPSPTDPNNYVCDNDCRSATNSYCPPVWAAIMLCRHARPI